MTTNTKPNVVSIFNRTDRKKRPELALDIPTKPAAEERPAQAAHVIPAGKPKMILAIGSGQTGKSTLLRWAAERAMERGSETVMATLAPNRTLKRYFPDTMHPDGNSTSAGAAFLEMFFDATAEDKVNAVLDFPGDDTALLHMLDQGADPVATMEQAGVEVVALFTLSPRVEDLTAMAQLVAKGFTPTATALILNQGVTRDPTLPPEPEFDAVIEHSAYCAAVKRGAVAIWMPRLYSAKSIEEEGSGLLFGRARNSPALGPSDRSRTHHWLRAMDEAFAPIASWLP